MTTEKIAIVTGGGSGLGLAIARRFTEAGMTCIIIGRRKDVLEDAARKIGKACIPLTGDLTDLQHIPELIQNIIAEYGKIDVLVNNAGINMKKDFLEVTDEEFQRILMTNVNSVFTISREVAKYMAQKGLGQIINISSMASQYGIPKVIAYTASKGAIEAMTRAMAVDLSPKGIRVNCIAPGFIATDMSAKALNSDPERKNKVLSRTPMGHLGEPADIAEAALFFAQESSKYITGTVLPVDGGNSIGF